MYLQGIIPNIVVKDSDPRAKEYESYVLSKVHLLLDRGVIYTVSPKRSPFYFSNNSVKS